MDKPLLRKLIADTSCLALQFQLAHWNVTGKLFNELHSFFGAQYVELNAAADLLAEHYRTLGEFAPGGLNSFADITSVKEVRAERKFSEDQWLKALLAGHQEVRKQAQALAEDAGKEGNVATEQIAIDRMLAHDKAIWMLLALQG